MTKSTPATNPFQLSADRRRRAIGSRLGGLHRAPEVNDRNQRKFHAEEPAVSFERARRAAIEAARRGEVVNPF